MDLTLNRVKLSDAEYEAIADQLIRDMRAINEQIQRNVVETERFKIETQLLRADFLRQSEENRALISRMKAMI